MRLTVPELTSAELLASLRTELVIALEVFMSLRTTWRECTEQPQQLTWAQRTWWSNFLSPQYKCQRGGAWLCSCCWAPGWFTCSSRGLPMPRLVCSNIKVRGYRTGLQYHEWMCKSASKPTVLFLSHPGNNRPPNGGNRSQDETNRRWQFFRQEAVGLQGSLQSAYMDSRADKKSTCRRDPLIATKQTNHTRLRKSPWAGNSARRYHMHLPCFFSSLGTYGYYWKQDTRQDGAVPWTSTAVLTT